PPTEVGEFVAFAGVDAEPPGRVVDTHPHRAVRARGGKLHAENLGPETVPFRDIRRTKSDVIQCLDHELSCSSNSRLPRTPIPPSQLCTDPVTVDALARDASRT